MKTAVRIAAALVAIILSSTHPSFSDAQGSVAGRLVAVQYPLDDSGTCAIEVETIGSPHTQIRVLLSAKLGQPSCPSLAFGDVVVIHFRLVPALCGPDLCAALWATQRPEKNL